MKHSESIAQLAGALVAAQADIKAVEKSAVNPHFKSKYVPLDSIVAMARPALATHGLCIAQSAEPSADGNALLVETMLVHNSGEWLSNAVHIPLAKKDPQGAGAAVTYGRRFGLSSLLNLTSEEDDDGNNASQPPAARPAAARGSRAAAPQAAPVAPNAPASNGSPEPDDVKVNDKRLGDHTDAELKALVTRFEKEGKRGYLKAVKAVQTNRALGTSKAPEPDPNVLHPALTAPENDGLPF